MYSQNNYPEYSPRDSREETQAFIKSGSPDEVFHPSQSFAPSQSDLPYSLNSPNQSTYSSPHPLPRRESKIIRALTNLGLLAANQTDKLINSNYIGSPKLQHLRRNTKNLSEQSANELTEKIAAKLELAAEKSRKYNQKTKEVTKEVYHETKHTITNCFYWFIVVFIPIIILMPLIYYVRKCHLYLLEITD